MTKPNRAVRQAKNGLVHFYNIFDNPGVLGIMRSRTARSTSAELESIINILSGGIDTNEMH